MERIGDFSRDDAILNRDSLQDASARLINGGSALVRSVTLVSVLVLLLVGNVGRSR